MGPDKTKRLRRRTFGTLANGDEVTLFSLTNSTGMSVGLMDLGATLVTLEVPDPGGTLVDTILGFDTPENYLQYGGYLGAVIGRYADRIRGGKFSLDGRDYCLTVNDRGNHLHGGEVGFDKRLWTGCGIAEDDSASVTFTLTSPDGEEGYPGAINVCVIYKLDDQNRLGVRYEATTSKPTVINLTQHAYFNLDGHDVGDISDHKLLIKGSAFTPVDGDMIPTGEIQSVIGSPFDFRKAKRIGEGIDAKHEQIQLAGGYDHNWVLDKPALGELGLMAEVCSSRSDRTMRVYTDQPGVQFYTGNFLSDNLLGKFGARYGRRAGFCLETQHFPNSPNQPSFPSTVLLPGDTYQTETIFQFT